MAPRLLRSPKHKVEHDDKATNENVNPFEIEYNPQNTNDQLYFIEVDTQRTVYNTSYGNISLDKDNSPKYHGQFNDDEIRSRTMAGLDLKDAFPNLQTHEEPVPQFSSKKFNKRKFEKTSPQTHGFRPPKYIPTPLEASVFEAAKPSYIDSQYFGDYLEKDKNENDYKSAEPHIDHKPFKPQRPITSNKSRMYKDVNPSRKQAIDVLPYENEAWSSAIDEEEDDVFDPFNPEDPDKILSPREEPYLHNYETHQTSQNVKQQRRFMQAAEALNDIHDEERERAREKIRNGDEDGSLESLFDLWSLVPSVDSMNERELIEMLRERVIYDKGDLLAIDKPYGLPVQRGKGVRMCVEELLPVLRERFFPKAEQLITLNRLDKNTSGIMLIGQSSQVFDEMRELYRAKQIYKRYFCITKGIPNPKKGIINMPLGRKLVSKFRYKVVPFSEGSQEKPSVGDIYDAVTEYQTIATANKASLIQCGMRTGFTHQIRSHLGFGINCPVLGDHKYSTYYGFKPQKLPGDMLHRLNIRLSKVRHLPMYLHSAEVQVPLPSGVVRINAPLPEYFVKTCRLLKLKLPRFM